MPAVSSSSVASASLERSGSEPALPQNAASMQEFSAPESTSNLSNRQPIHCLPENISEEQSHGEFLKNVYFLHTFFKLKS